MGREMMLQADLFADRPAPPEGLAYCPELITPGEEQSLVQHLAGLPFRPFEFGNYVGKREIVSFGWRYAFDGSGLHEAEPIPEFLRATRGQAARFGGMEPDRLAQVLVTKYEPGAVIGWHRDRSVFGEVVGVSLLTPARLRLRRRRSSGWQRTELMLEPRSAYHLSGPARDEWEHSIPALQALRYSITFRTLR